MFVICVRRLHFRFRVVVCLFHIIFTYLSTFDMCMTTTTAARMWSVVWCEVERSVFVTARRSFEMHGAWDSRRKRGENGMRFKYLLHISIISLSQSLSLSLRQRREKIKTHLSSPVDLVRCNMKFTHDNFHTRTHINIRPENFRPNSFNFFVVIQCLATVATVALTPPRVCVCVCRIKLKCVHLNRSNENVWV